MRLNLHIRPTSVLREQKGVRDCVRHFHLGEELLRAALRDVLVAAGSTAHDGLPLQGHHFIERDLVRGERHEEPPVPFAARERRRRAHPHPWRRERDRAFDNGARVRQPDEQIEQVTFGRRHGKRPRVSAIRIDGGDTTRDTRIDTDEPHASRLYHNKSSERRS
jgi:hypothetical protein